MTLTATKAQLLALLHDFPDDANFYVMAPEAVETASRTEEKDVFLRIASTNVLQENNGVSLIAYVD